MIEFINISKEKPFILFKRTYHTATKAGQKNIEAILISSYNKMLKEVDSRLVNIKFIEEDRFIFFTNYNSPKAKAFQTHNQISAVFFWPSINSQIRIKANIYKTSEKYNLSYFKQRATNKNILSISSNQSEPISDYQKVIYKYNKIKERDDLNICPDYWGGYSLIPYEIEFWKGNDSRLNKRELYTKNENTWRHSILEP